MLTNVITYENDINLCFKDFQVKLYYIIIRNIASRLWQTVSHFVTHSFLFLVLKYLKKYNCNKICDRYQINTIITQSLYTPFCVIVLSYLSPEQWTCLVAFFKHTHYFPMLKKLHVTQEPVTIGFFGVRLWYLEIQIPIIHIQNYFDVTNCTM